MKYINIVKAIVANHKSDALAEKNFKEKGTNIKIHKLEKQQHT